MFKSVSLTWKLVGCFILIGIVPSVALQINSYFLSKSAKQGLSNQAMTQAIDIADKIDRNLFERYGDVQAFGYNKAVENKDDWYKKGADNNQIVRAMNNYVVAYGMYYVTLFVDTMGEVVAVNDVDKGGKAINTESFYSKNFAKAQWFKDAVQGNFYTKEGALTGTVLEDVHVDGDIASIYGDEGLTIGFSAPVKDDKGNLLGVWKNYARFDLVEQVVMDSYQLLENQGYKTFEITLTDKNGLVLVDYNPVHEETKDIKRDMEKLLKLNLVDKGVASIKGAVNGRTGVSEENSIEGDNQQIAGYSQFHGALGFIGMPWVIRVAGDSDEIFAAISTSNKIAVLVFVCALAGIALVIWYSLGSISKPIEVIIGELKSNSRELRASSDQVSSAAQSLALGASQNAASLQESAAALEQVSAMSRQTSDNAHVAQSLSDNVRDASEGGVKAMDQMSGTIQSMQNAAEETETILKTIDEIAFQTNLLALNAAVEAARAGEAGKGFAVVAEEVRNLAQRSAQAAKDTSEKIRIAKDQAFATVRATGQVATALDNISNSAVKSAGLVKEISLAILEQTHGITQVNGSVTDLDKVTQQNAAAAEESSAAAVELKGQAANLDTVVSKLSELVYGR